MAQRLKEVDVVVVGLGAAGGTVVWPLAKDGLSVVGIEAGPRVTTRDFPFDEIRNDIRDHMGRWKANLEVPTSRPSRFTAASQAQPPGSDRPEAPANRPFGATGPMMNAVGGTSIHWMTQSWRLLPWNFQARTRVLERYGPGAIPAGSTLADWPFTYDELEPYYDKLEYEVGTSGQAGNIKGKIDARGNVYEGPRQRGYPLPPLRRSGWTDLMAAAAKTLGWKPYPGPAGIREQVYRHKPACTYCGFCGWTGCYTNAKVSTNVDFIPMAEKTKNLQVVPLARVTEVNVDGNGRATGVTYVRGRQTYFQPAKMVVLASYAYENVRLLLLSKSPAYPNGLSNNHGQVGKHFMAHGLSSASVSGVFPGHRLNRYSGSIGQFTAIDEWDADNFDHAGMGFITGGMCSATMEQKPIGVAGLLPPGTPRWGSGYKAWLKANADSVGTASAQVETLSYEDNYLDLDPTVKDPLGLPVIRVTFDLKDNEKRAALFLQAKLNQWLKAAGAAQTWTFPPVARPVNTHAYGGTRAGLDPATSVVDKFFVSHEVPNLAVLGGSSFATTGGRNPTETIQATSWRTGEYISAKWKSLTA
jgi:gluconate 2-dehydrogenase alpha chain